MLPKLWGSILSQFQRGSSLQCFCCTFDSIKWAQYDRRVRPTHQHSLIGRHMAWISESLITLLGVLAVFTQLRTLLKAFSIIEMNDYESGSGV